MDNVDGDVAAYIETDASKVVPTSAGVYRLVYVAVDRAGSRAEPVARTVIVSPLAGGGGAIDWICWPVW